MKILSVYGSLPSTVSLIIDNKVISSVNEERFTRKKNDSIFPRNAINYCLKNSNIKSQDLDGVAIASLISPFDDNLVRRCDWSVEDYLKEQVDIWKPFLVDKTDMVQKSLLEVFPEKIDFNQFPADYANNIIKGSDRLAKHNVNTL